MIPRLTPQQSMLVAALAKAGGAFVAHDRLRDRMHSHHAGPFVLKVQVCNVRKVIGHGAIENSYANGYRLTELGLAKVSAALVTA